jgi:hypothetical protein
MTAGTTHVTSSIPTRGLFVRQLAGRLRSRDRLGHRAACPRHRGTASHRAPEDAVELRWPSSWSSGRRARRFRTFRYPPTGGPSLRGADGRLALHHGGDTFTIHERLAADADGRDGAAPEIGRKVWSMRGARWRSAARVPALSSRLRAREAFDRPWSPQRARTAAAPASPNAAPDVPPASRSPPRDATPRSEDLQPDD